MLRSGWIVHLPASFRGRDMAETWKPVPSWEGMYEVSDEGRVRSLERRFVDRLGRPNRVPGRVRRQHVKPDGHCSVGLKGEGRYEQLDVHVMVLSAFVSARPAGCVARHLNGDPQDNRLENLAWGTWSENNYDQVRHGTHSEAAKTHCAQGHPLSGDNLSFRRHNRNHRVCKQCQRDATRRYVDRKRRRLADLVVPS